MFRLLRSFQHDESGATAIEYCLLGGLIFLAIVLSLTTLGSRVTNVLTNVGTSLR